MFLTGKNVFVCLLRMCDFLVQLDCFVYSYKIILMKTPGHDTLAL